MDVVTLALAKKGAKSYTDTVINNLPKGVVYRGSVNYYADLPSAAALGDCYTVAYKGTTGTEPYGAEYIWGLNTATNIREWIKIGEEIDLSKYATENWVNEQISDFLPDAETYTIAELTEGQITDVIGVNDIVIKGQTSQDGILTPSAPVDVNVVSGSNVVNTSNKNLFDGILENSGFQATGLNAGGNTKRIRSKNYTRVKENQTYTINITEYNTTKGTISITISYYNKNDYSTARLSESGWKNLPYTFITPENCKFIRFLCKITSSSGESEIIYTDVNKVQLEQSSTATTYEPHQGKELPLDLGSIELCKIWDYQDYFYKSGSKWYLHKEIERLILGDYNWTLANNTSISNINTNRWYIAHSCSRLPNNSAKVIMSNILPMGTANSTYGQDEIGIGQSTSQTVIRMPVEYTTASAIKTALQDISAYAYVLKNEAINTEITDTTLISQLEAIYNAPLYEQTNITQTNNDLPMVLDITACKDNINGIKAFIRK